MADVVFTEQEWQLIKNALDEAYATRNYLSWLAGLARRIVRDDIEQPGLRAALEALNGVDIKTPRTVEAVGNDVPDRQRNRTAKARRS